MPTPDRFFAFQKPPIPSSKVSKSAFHVSHKKTNVDPSMFGANKDQVIKQEPEKSSKLIHNRPQPKQKPMNKKGEMISKGKVANRAGYPTMEDILSDWGTATEEAQTGKKVHSNADKTADPATKLDASLDGSNADFTPNEK
ncbi:hypothetical protein M3Y97_00203100 [Aphelenchoides bicaudatus]|nr:hypothetical protein M3Y97_00203100 [Aphelenchoides bicaudatus]